MVDDTEQLCAAWLLCQLATSERGSYDAGVTCVSRVIFSTLHWSVLTVYFKRKLPASVYAVGNEQGFLTPGVFSCNAYSFRSCPVTSAPVRVPPGECTAAGRGACWNAHPTRCTRPGTGQAAATCRAAPSATTAAAVLRRPRWPLDCAGDLERIGALRSSFFEQLLWSNIRQLWHYYLCFCCIIITLVFKRIS